MNGVRKETAEGRILGIDLGEKRIGLAVSDPLNLIAQGVPTLTGLSEKQAFAAIGALVLERAVARIVLGLPLNMNGSEGPQARNARRFGEDLRRALRIPVDFWDERLTSRSAERVLLEADMSRRRRKLVLDRLSAQLILQGYLDNKKQVTR
ncbi:MAG: Holliday junction resolvase RuvX [Candidatus Aureabacteria bacterium]|nr:Holliday junction resolvase RuvX [Candidatus Auribacterota bacterium]